MKTYDPISIDPKGKRRKKKKKKSLSLLMLSLSRLTFPFLFYLLIFIIIIIFIWIYDSYCLIRIRFSPEPIYFFSVQFILNELSSSHFLTSEIFVKISSLKSLIAYHPKNRKIFRLSQNSMKLFWVTRFRKTNLTA